MTIMSRLMGRMFKLSPPEAYDMALLQQLKPARGRHAHTERREEGQAASPNAFDTNLTWLRTSPLVVPCT